MNTCTHKEGAIVVARIRMLAHIVSLTQNVVVAGSHGKTTTTSLISGIFSKAKLDPTIINGGVINSIQNSARLGKSKWCVLLTSLGVDASEFNFVDSERQ